MQPFESAFSYKLINGKRTENKNKQRPSIMKE